jgi:hypothetical protein
MTTTRAPADLFADAADLVRERVLLKGTSLSRARDRLWREPHLSDLLARLRTAAAREEGDLAERWDGVLAGAPRELVQLAAEALAVHLLIASDVRPATKRAQLAATLAHLDPPGALPEVVDLSLDHGRTPTGIAFKRRRLSQVAFLLTAAASWRARPAAERRSGLDDPWGFREWLRTVPVDGAHAQREALLHLVHPCSFEAIASVAAKRRIVEALGRRGEQDPDHDLALLSIRDRLEDRYGVGFSFGDEPLLRRWLR